VQQQALEALPLLPTSSPWGLGGEGMNAAHPKVAKGSSLDGFLFSPSRVLKGVGPFAA